MLETSVVNSANEPNKKLGATFPAVLKHNLCNLIKVAVITHKLKFQPFLDPTGIKPVLPFKCKTDGIRKTNGIITPSAWRVRTTL